MIRGTRAWLWLGVLAVSACGGGGDSGTPGTHSAPLAISPVSIEVLVNSTQTFTASGGTPPYQFSIVSGGGSIDSSTGKFTAPAVAATVKVQVTDSSKRSVIATVQVLAALAIAPVNPSIGATTSTVFSASGGRSPYTFSVLSGSGTIDSSSGQYVAPSATGTATIGVMDADGHSAQTTVTINPALSITPSRIAMTAASNYSYSFAAQGGVPPYAYSVTGPGSVNPTSGLYTAGTSSGTATLKAQDAQGSIVTATIDSIWVRTNAAVRAAMTDGTSWYLGGDFDSVNAYRAAKMIALDATTGDPILACNVAEGFDGNVRALLQAGSTVFIGGDFTKYRGVAANHLAKIDAATCELDTAFSGQGTDQAVSVLALSGNALYLGGDFLLYRGAPAQFLAKIDATTGALDTVFTQSLGLGGSPRTIAVSSDAVYVGGNFTAYRGQGAAFLVKLDPTSGAPDTTFGQSPGLDGPVSALALDGQSLYVGGQMLDYRSAAVTSIIKINATSGDIDPAFSQGGGPDQVPVALAVSSSALYAGGQFSNYRGVPVSNLIKVDKATGALDSGFAAAAQLDGAVTTLVLSGSSAYVAGDFSSYAGIPARFLAKVDATTGSLDRGFTQSTGFDPTALINFHHVDALSIQDSSLLVGGSFETYRGSAANHVAKVDIATGVSDLTFNSGTGFNHTVWALVLDGNSLYIGGGDHYRDQSLGGLVRVNKATGAPDSQFNSSPGFAGPVEVLALSGSSLYVGGGFASFGSTPVPFLAKLNTANGALDASFNPQVLYAGTVHSLALSGASVFAGGEFYPSLTKLDANTGARDPAYSNIDTNNVVLSVLASGTSVYVAGTFQYYSGTPAIGLVKVDAASGAIDTQFTQSVVFGGPPFYVNTLAATHDWLYAGGAFSSYRNAPAASIAKIDLVSGQLDTTFSQSTGPSGPIYAIAPRDSAIWIGGDFHSYRGTPAYFFIPLDPTTGASLDTSH